MALCVALCAFAGALRAQERSGATQTSWRDVAPFQARLERHGVTETAFAAYITRVREENARRVRDGDLDHLIFYLLQSTRFTEQPPIEPALSAKTLVDAMSDMERSAFLNDPRVASGRIAGPVRARVAALLHALDRSARDPRLAYFQALVQTQLPVRQRREEALLAEYLRVMRFVYEKEFVAQRSARPAEAIADLYRSRGLSTDTAVEAGFLVHTGLGVAKSLDAERTIRRVLIVGPGLDLAPRTALNDARPPESYQPWAVIDALLTLKLSRAEDLEVVAADINPRVVDHLRRSRDAPPTLTLVSEIRDDGKVTLSEDYRSYFAQLGRGLGQELAEPVKTHPGHLSKRVTVSRPVAQLLKAVRLDVVTERLEGPAFDIVIATNILPYFDDPQLVLAVSNLAAAMAPGGIFLHNEARPLLRELTEAAGLSFEQSRHAIIATVRGAPAPLFDSVWVHRKR